MVDFRQMGDIYLGINLSGAEPRVSEHLLGIIRRGHSVTLDKIGGLRNLKPPCQESRYDPLILPFFSSPPPPPFSVKGEMYSLTPSAHLQFGKIYDHN